MTAENDLNDYVDPSIYLLDEISAHLQAHHGGNSSFGWGTVRSYAEGGDDPLDMVEAYQVTKDAVPHLHFCTYGFSPQSVSPEEVAELRDQEFFEVTFRLTQPSLTQADTEWVCHLLQKLARYVFRNHAELGPYDCLDFESPLNPKSETKLVGLAFVPDPLLAPMQTSLGRLNFVQAFGITGEELELLKNESLSCEELLEQHRRGNPLLITDVSSVT